jgi:hypothetical protein
MKLIPLNHGLSAMVDDEDYDALMLHTWHAAKHHTGKFYASTNGKYVNRKRKPPIKMHRLILSAPKGMCADHINGDTLNNQRINLRLCTAAQNAKNRKKDKTNKSGFKGVNRFNCRKNPWVAQISVDGKKKHLGLFATPLLAAQAYDKAAKQYHGEFASLNF